MSYADEVYKATCRKILEEGYSDEGLDVLLVTESADGRLAQTVKDSMKKKNCEILVLDSLQSVTEDMVEEGYTYIGAMESNLAVIKSALA